MNLFCLFGCHDLALAYSETEGFHRCKRCQQRIGEPWKVLRPEQVIAAQQAHAAVMRDREKRVKRLSEPERAKIVRFR